MLVYLCMCLALNCDSLCSGSCISSKMFEITFDPPNESPPSVKAAVGHLSCRQGDNLYPLKMSELLVMTSHSCCLL